MALVVGTQRTDTGLQVRRKLDMRGAIYKLEPDAAPFTQILANIKDTKAAINSTFSWAEVSPEGRFGVTTQTRVSTDTTVTVDDGTMYSGEYLVAVPRTGEVISVTSVSTNTLTIERGVGGTTAAAMNSGEQFYILGVAATEADYSKPARTVVPVQKTNFTEIFKRSVEASGTELSSSEVFDEHEWNRMTAEQLVQHKKDKELAFILGQPEERTSVSSTSSGKRRLTGGLLHYLTSNNQAGGGTLTTATLRTWYRALFRYGSNERTIFASALVLSAVDSFVEGKLQLRPNDRAYNVSMAQMVTSSGVVNFVRHPLLEGGTLQGYAIGIDFADSYLSYRPLNGSGPGGSRDTHTEENVQAPDFDGRRDQIMAEVGLQAGLPGVHGVLTGVTGPG